MANIFKAIARALGNDYRNAVHGSGWRERAAHERRARELELQQAESQLADQAQERRGRDLRNLASEIELGSDIDSGSVRELAGPTNPKDPDELLVAPESEVEGPVPQGFTPEQIKAIRKAEAIHKYRKRQTDQRKDELGLAGAEAELSERGPRLQAYINNQKALADWRRRPRTTTPKPTFTDADMRAYRSQALRLLQEGDTEFTQDDIETLAGELLERDRGRLGGGDSSPTPGPAPARAPGGSAPQAPQPGTEKRFKNGRVGVWDGQGWVLKGS